MLVLLILGFLTSSEVKAERGPASIEFPRHKATSDVGDIMDDYPEYLQFVLSIGRDVNPKVAAQIEERYSKLRKADERLAARFLKGLRFEMIQKLELSGLSPKRVSTSTPVMRKWVAKYLPAWLREVDEYQFRAYAFAMAKRNSRT
jgi:hypothetical protein